MNPLKNRVTTVAYFIGAIWLTSFTATNPDYNFPGIFECIIASASLLVLAPLSTRKPAQFARSERAFFIALALLIVILAARYVGAFSDAVKPGAALCMKLPSYIPKLECLLQQPISENYGLRQLLFHCTALFVFFTSASLARSSKVFLPRLGMALTIPPLCLAMYQLAVFYFPLNTSLVGNNFVTGGTMPLTRGTAIVSNPSWLAPLLMPAMALAIGLTRSALRSIKWQSAIVALVLACATFAAQQRAGYLVLVIYFVTILLNLAVVLLRRSKTTAAIFLVIFPILAVCAWLRSTVILDSVGSLLHLPVRASGISFDQNRYQLWKIAWSDMGQHFLWGHGYQSWLHEFTLLSQSAGMPHLAFDTAHNLWVQILFELGVPHLCLIVFVFLFGIFSVARNWSELPFFVKSTWLFLGAGLAVITAVQEIDYINTVYYSFALICGYLYGARISTPSEVRGRKSLGAQRIRLSVPAALRAGAAVALFFGVILFTQYSWGGYAFELSRRGPNLGFERWYRPWGAITAFPTRSRTRYSIFPLLSPHTETAEPQAIAIFSNETAIANADNLVIENGSKYWGNQVKYQTSHVEVAPQRLLSLRVSQMAWQTNLGIFWSEGTYDWESAGNGTDVVEKWCAGSCTLFLKGTVCSGQTSLIISAPRQDVSPQNLLSVQLSVKLLSVFPFYHLANATHAEDKKHQVDKVAENETDLAKTIDSPAKSYELKLPVLSGEWGWAIRLKTSSTFNGKKMGISSDDRDLGVRLTNVVCH